MDFAQPFIDYLLFLATGAERGRSQADGQLRVGRTRPVGVITTIEGIFKAELRKRCVDVQYGVPGPRLPRAPIEREIKERRHEIGSAMMAVLGRYLEIKDDRRETFNT